MQKSQAAQRRKTQKGQLQRSAEEVLLLQ
jgi:hypothetical protein